MMIGRAASPRTRNLAIAAATLTLLAAPIAVLVALEPVVALVALAVIGALLLAAARVDIALLLLVASAPLETAIRISPDPMISITKVFGALTFGGFVLNAIVTRRSFRLAWTHGAVIGILVLTLVSTVQARDVDAALITTLRYASFVALYLVISQLAQDERMPRRIVWALTLSAAAAAGWALYEYFGQGGRAATPRGDPNDDAFTWITALPLTLWLLAGSARRLRPVILAMAATLVVATFFSLSRGALVGLGVGILWELFVERRHGRVLVGAATLAVLGGIVAVGLNPERVETSLEQKGTVAEENVDIRLDAWVVATDLAAQQPFLGIGPGNFHLYYPEESGHPVGTRTIGVVHNAYLDIAVELGVGGLILFLAYLAGSFVQLGAARSAGVGPPGLAAAARTALVVACAAALFLSEQYFQPFWLLGGIGAALWAGRRTGTGPSTA